MYRLTITTATPGLDADHIAWRMFRLMPHGHTRLTTTYSCRLQANLSELQRQIIQGWQEEGDILGFACEQIDE